MSNVTKDFLSVGRLLFVLFLVIITTFILNLLLSGLLAAFFINAAGLTGRVLSTFIAVVFLFSWTYIMRNVESFFVWIKWIKQSERITKPFVKSKHIERVQNIKLTDEKVKKKRERDKLLYIVGVLIFIMILAVVLTR